MYMACHYTHTLSGGVKIQFSGAQLVGKFIVIVQKQFMIILSSCNYVQYFSNSIELYNQSWGEAKEWILEKVSAVAGNYPTTGNQTQENLQRKLEIIEQEITPVQDKLRKLGILATV